MTTKKGGREAVPFQKHSLGEMRFVVGILPLSFGLILIVVVEKVFWGADGIRGTLRGSLSFHGSSYLSIKTSFIEMEAQEAGVPKMRDG